MQIRCWSSDVCSSDHQRHPGAPFRLARHGGESAAGGGKVDQRQARSHSDLPSPVQSRRLAVECHRLQRGKPIHKGRQVAQLRAADRAVQAAFPIRARSEEHTSELQSLMRISYAVFRLKKKKKNINTTQ